jgi:hypothetical protein
MHPEVVRFQLFFRVEGLPADLTLVLGMYRASVLFQFHPGFELFTASLAGKIFTRHYLFLSLKHATDGVGHNPVFLTSGILQTGLPNELC